MEYKLTRRRGQKSIRMHFNDKGELLVSCPYLVSVKQVEAFIESKKDWISANKKQFVSHTYQDGDILPYFGQNLRLKVVECRKTHVDVVENNIFVFAKKTNPDHIKRILKKFYAEKLYSFCEPRLTFWAEKLLVRTPNLQITNSKSRWGVCYPTQNTVKMSLISATLEPDLLDMIVLHESCHLVYCNHQREFYALMEKNMPDFKEKNTRFKRFAKTGVHRNLF